MDKKRMAFLADAIELGAGTDRLHQINGGARVPVKFDMSYFMARFSCGTAACVAGHAVLLFGHPGDEDEMFEAAARILKLRPEQARKLFVPEEYDGLPKRLENDYSKITRKHAVAVIRHAVKTGKVDWSIKT